MPPASRRLSEIAVAREDAVTAHLTMLRYVVLMVGVLACAVGFMVRPSREAVDAIAAEMVTHARVAKGWIKDKLTLSKNKKDS